MSSTSPASKYFSLVLSPKKIGQFDFVQYTNGNEATKLLPRQPYTCNMAGTDVMDRQNKVKPTLEMKQRAVKYYTDNDVPKCLEGLLNKMFLDGPDDIYGYMVREISTSNPFCLPWHICFLTQSTYSY